MGCVISANKAYKRGTKVKFRLPPLPDAVQATIAKTGKPGPAIKPKGKKFAALVAAAKCTEQARKGFERQSENKEDSSQGRNRTSNEPVINKGKPASRGILQKKSDDNRDSSAPRSGDTANRQDRLRHGILVKQWIGASVLESEKTSSGDAKQGTSLKQGTEIKQPVVEAESTKPRAPVKKLSEMRSRIAIVAHFQAELRKQREREKENADKVQLEEKEEKLTQSMPVKKALQKLNRGHHSSEDVADVQAQDVTVSIDSVTGHHLRRRLCQKALYMQKCVKFSAKNSICSSESD